MSKQFNLKTVDATPYVAADLTSREDFEKLMADIKNIPAEKMVEFSNIILTARRNNQSVTLAAANAVRKLTQ